MLLHFTIKTLSNFSQILALSLNATFVIKKMIKLIDKKKPKCIINCSGFTNVDECEKNQTEAQFLNVEVVKFLSKFSKEEKSNSFRFLLITYLMADRLFTKKLILKTQ